MGTNLVVICRQDLLFDFRKQNCCRYNIGNSLIITQNGKPRGVVISPREYDKLQYTNNFINSIAEGLEDSMKGDVVSTSDLRETLKQIRAKREL